MIPFNDLAALHRPLMPQLMDACRRVIETGQFILGPELDGFEQDFAASCGCQHAVAVNSCTSALHVALLAAGIGPGDEVITTPLTFIATLAAIEAAGATIRLADVDAQSWTLDPAQVAAAITPRTRAIVPVHLHGRLADMDAILAIARRHGLMVIEDAAQAHGAALGGRQAGAWGDAGCFSFYPAKNLGACGEGGCVVTNDAGLAARVRSLRHWSQDRDQIHLERGFNYRMDALQAALLRVKLPHLAAWTQVRRHLADRYRARLGGSAAILPAPSMAHAHHVFAVRVPQRDAVRARLAPLVQTGIHYRLPAHLQPAYADLGFAAGDFPVSEDLARSFISLPLHPCMTEADVDTVCAALLSVLEDRSVAA